MTVSVHGVVVRGEGEPVGITEVLPLEKFVSETIAPGDVEAAFIKMERGEVLRSVVVF